MKKLLNTLYITASDRYLSLDGENVVILQGDEKIARYPLHCFESIVTYGYTGASPALMAACAERNISICFMTSYGKFLARVTGEMRGNVLLRKTQYRYSDDENQSCHIAKSFLAGKIYNAKWVLERASRDYPLRLDVENIKRKTEFLNACMNNIYIVRRI